MKKALQNLNIALLIICFCNISFITVAQTADQSNTGGNFEYMCTTDGQIVGQSFTAGISGKLTSVALDMSINSCALAASYTFVTDIIDGNGYGGTVIASKSVTVSLPLSRGMLPINFTTPATVVSGQQYTIRLTPQANQVCMMMMGTPINVCAAWLQSTGDTYTGGVPYFNGSQDGDRDKYFTTYVTVTPAAAFQADATACANDCIAITNNSTAATSWHWTFAGGTPSTSSLQNPGSVCYANPGNYNIKLVATNGGLSDSTSHTINVYAQPSLQITGSQLCDASKLNWAQWTSVNGTTAQGVISSDLSMTVTQSGGGLSTTPTMFAGNVFPTEYNVPISSTTIRNDNAGIFTFCFNKPVINPQIALSSIGGGNEVTITTSAPYTTIWEGPGMTYPNDTTFMGWEGYTIVQFPGVHTCLTFNYHQPEVYCNLAFGVKDTNCQATAIPPICVGSNVPLTATGNQSLNNSFTWSPSTGLNTTTGASVIASPSVTTTYYVTCTAGNCSITDSVTVVVNQMPAPVVSISGYASICSGQLDTLTATGDGTYLWNTGATTSSILADPNNSRNYKVIVTGANNCIATADMNVTATPLAVSITGNTSFCDGDSTTLDAGANYTDYNWSNGETTRTIRVAENNSFSVHVVNSFGCEAQSANVNTTVSILPSAHIQQLDCNGSTRLESRGAEYEIPYDYDPVNNYNYGSFIDGFSFAGIDNQASGGSPNNNSGLFYTLHTADTASAEQGSAYSFTITPPSYQIYSLTYAIWIDFNNNGSFDDDGEMVYNAADFSNPWSTGAYSDSITIPSDVPSYTTRMRVRTSQDDNYYEGTSARGDFGETEDYIIRIGSGNARTYSWTSQPAGFTSSVLNPGINVNADTTYFLTVSDSVTGCVKTTSARMDSTMITTAGEYGNHVWNVYAYNGVNKDHFRGYYIDNELNFSTANRWGGMGSPSDAYDYMGCTVDNNNFSVEFNRKGLSPGLYSIDVIHTGDVYLYINDSLVFTHLLGDDTDFGVWTGVLNNNSKISYRLVDSEPGYAYGGINFNLISSFPGTGTITGTNAVCQGASNITYTASAFTDADAYIWTLPNGATIVSGDSTNSIEVNFAGNATSGDISVYGINQFGSGNVADYSVTVNVIPSVTATSPGSRCDEGTVALSAAASEGMLAWYAALTGGSVIDTGASFTTPTINTSTEYFVEAISNNCPSARSAVMATVNHSASSMRSVRLCAGQQLTVGTSTFNTSGTHTANLTTVNGCDSTVTIQMTVANPITGSQTISLCDGETISVGVHTYSTSGTYTDVVAATSGCDSTVTTYLTVNNAIDISTTVNFSTITANEASATYQWVDCNNNNAFISGETGQSFTATTNGDFAVIVTVNNCSQISACENITMTGLKILSNAAFGVYPNPNNGAFTMKAQGEVVYSIVNELGQTIAKGILNSANNYSVDMQEFNNGIYYITGYNDHSTIKQKIVVTK